MLRILYTAAISIAAPLALTATALRGLKDPAYRDRLGERLGFTRVRFTSAPLWVHAVSVGEVQAAAPLVRALQARYPDQELLVTTATPTGAQRVHSLFGDSVRHAYLPYDTRGAVRRFLDRTKPRVAIVMEREIWPTLFAACARRGIPVLLASARISERSAQRHRKFAALFAPALAHNVTIAAQTSADAERYRAIGAPAQAVHVVGNLKFDLEPPAGIEGAGLALRTAFGDRPVWIAGSTHEAEEGVLIEAHERVRSARRDALLIVAPRHPQRFGEAADMLRKRGVRFVTRSSKQAIGDASVLLADTLGELMVLYAASDVAFVGGSLAPIGGHNLLEPAVLGKAILVGPHNFNAQEVANLLLGVGAARIVNSEQALGDAVLELMSAPEQRRAMGARGAQVVEQNRGALERLLKLVDGAERSSGQRSTVNGQPSSIA